MQDFLLSGAETLLANSENITLGVILLSGLFLLAATTFTFVHLALKVSRRVSDDRSEERAGDQSVIDKLFELVQDFNSLSSMNKSVEKSARYQERLLEQQIIESEKHMEFRTEFLERLDKMISIWEQR